VVGIFFDLIKVNDIFDHYLLTNSVELSATRDATRCAAT
jgi:hypothetical protein